MREELIAARGTVLREGRAYLSPPGFSLIRATHVAASKETDGAMILRSHSSPRRSLLPPPLAQTKEYKVIPPAASTPNIPPTVLMEFLPDRSRVPWLLLTQEDSAFASGGAVVPDFPTPHRITVSPVKQKKLLVYS